MNDVNNFGTINIQMISFQENPCISATINLHLFIDKHLNSNKKKPNMTYDVTYRAKDLLVPYY